ncbi:hypothetical protein ACFCP7_28190 [Paenibacillus elgii]
MKPFFKAAAISLCAAILVGGNITRAADAPLTKQQKNEIMNVYSYDQAVIDLLPEEKLKKLYNERNQILDVVKSEKYIKIDIDTSDPANPKELSVKDVPKQEYEAYKIKQATVPDVMPFSSTCGASGGYDCVKESWIKMETWISQTSSSNGMVSMRFEWLTKPFFTRTDVMAIGLNSGFSPIPDTEYGIYKHLGNYGWVNHEWTRAEKRDAGGYGFKFDLDNTHNKHQGYMSYNFTKNNSNAIVADAYSHYAHSQKIFSGDVSFAIPLGGSLQISKDDFDVVQGHAQKNPW